MRLIVNTGFAILTAVLYGFVAGVILWKAMSTEGYTPNDAQTTLFGLTSGAVIAFLVAQLGLAVGNPESGPGDSLKAAVSGDKSKGRGDLILGFVALVFVIFGLWYVLLWVIPDLIAASDNADAASEAPEFIALQAKAFIGIVLAGFAAVATSMKNE